MTHQESGETGTLSLGGALTLRSVDDILAKFLDASARYTTLEVVCDTADEVDLGFIQLLLAARLSAQAANRTIRLAQPASGALLGALQRGGFLSDKITAERAFWLRPENG